MKNFIAFVAYGFAVGVGYFAGTWAWENVLEDKVDNLKERLDARKES